MLSTGKYVHRRNSVIRASTIFISMSASNLAIRINKQIDNEQFSRNLLLAMIVSSQTDTDIVSRLPATKILHCIFLTRTFSVKNTKLFITNLEDMTGERPDAMCLSQVGVMSSLGLGY
jgi:hypothetical protein